jgi:membrane protein
MQQQLIYWRAFANYVFGGFQSDKCSSVAAELTVTSLLALVPLTTVMFALLALVPNFQNMALQLQELMFEYFVPSTGESVQNYLAEFVGKAKSMSGVGFLMLLVTALLMMRTIDISFNNIWQINSKKSVLRTFLVYWAILTLGPIFLGTSLIVTSYLKSLPLLSDVVQQNSQWMTVGLPMLMESIAFALMFFVIPNRKILFKHAIIAAIITASFFEIAKSGFGIFVDSFSTYQVIFGALATIPLFLIWVYLSWSIILFGAEICHGLFAFEVDQHEHKIHPFIQLLQILLILADKQAQGDSISEEQLVDHDDWGGREANVLWLERLIDAGVVAKLQNQSYCLTINSSEINYKIVYEVASRLLPDKSLVLDSALPDEIKKQIVDLLVNHQELLNQKLLVPQVNTADQDLQD